MAFDGEALLQAQCGVKCSEQAERNAADAASQETSKNLDEQHAALQKSQPKRKGFELPRSCAPDRSACRPKPKIWKIGNPHWFSL